MVFMTITGAIDYTIPNGPVFDVKGGMRCVIALSIKIIEVNKNIKFTSHLFHRYQPRKEGKHVGGKAEHTGRRGG